MLRYFKINISICRFRKVIGIDLHFFNGLVWVQFYRYGHKLVSGLESHKDGPFWSDMIDPASGFLL